MALLSFSDVSLAYGLNPLLDKVSFQLDRGERVCLIGRNGAGKSSLFRLVTGEQGADEGDIWFAPGLKIGQLPQELPAADDKTVYDVVASGLAGVGELLAEYHHLITGDMGDAELARLEKVQVQLEAKDGWRLDQLVDTTLTRLGLPADKQMSELSGGWRRRVLLAQALVAEPDVLLLDEPTNHLDIHTIAWLESVLLEFRGAVLFITHDRSFLQALATRILELDRGQLIDWQGDYRSFLEHKEQQLAAEATANALFDKKLAQEEAWIRQGIKARRTRNEGRVRALEAMKRFRLMAEGMRLSGLTVVATAAMRDAGVSIESLIQQGDAAVPHIRAYLNKMEDVDFVVQRTEEEEEGRRGRGRGEEAHHGLGGSTRV